MAQAPDGRMFVTQQGGQLRIVKNGALLGTPFVTLAVDPNGERGLLGVALHPDFANNRFVYLYYTTTQNGTHNRISRFTADAANPNVAEAGSEVPIVDLPALSGATNHNGGAMNFGLDGKLYVAVGDNANSAKAPDLNDPFGKMLRFNDDGSIPADNPFCTTPATLRVPSGPAACATRSPLPCAPATGACTSTMSARTPGKRSTWARRAPTTAGRPPKGRPAPPA